MTLKKFIKYFDDMNELFIYDWNMSDKSDKALLFKGYTFDDGAEKKLKRLYKMGYVLERNEDGMAVILLPYQNEYGANLCNVQINVCLPNKTKEKERYKL